MTSQWTLRLVRVLVPLMQALVVTAATTSLLHSLHLIPFRRARTEFLCPTESVQTNLSGFAGIHTEIQSGDFSLVSDTMACESVFAEDLGSGVAWCMETTVVGNLLLKVEPPDAPVTLEITRTLDGLYTYSCTIDVNRPWSSTVVAPLNRPLPAPWVVGPVSLSWVSLAWVAFLVRCCSPSPGATRRPDVLHANANARAA